MSYLPPGMDQSGLTAIASALGTPDAISAYLLQSQFPFQMGIQQAQADTATNIANQQFGFGQQGRGIQQGALNREQQYLPQQQGLANQLIGLQGQDLGIQRQRLGLSREQLGLQGQGLDITERGERQQADIANRGAWSSGTARGATNTSGFRSGLGDIQNNLANQLQQLGLSRQGLGIQGRGLDLSGQGLDISQQRIGIGQQQSDIGYALRQGGLSDQQAQLGLAGQEAQAGLTNQLGQIGVDQLMGQQGVYGNISNQLIGAAQRAPGFAGQGGAISGAQPNSSPVQPRVGGRNNTPGGAGPVF